VGLDARVARAGSGDEEQQNVAGTQVKGL